MRVPRSPDTQGIYLMSQSHKFGITHALAVAIVLPFIVTGLVHQAVFGALSRIEPDPVQFFDWVTTTWTLIIATPITAVAAFLFVSKFARNRLLDGSARGFGFARPRERWIAETAGYTALAIAVLWVATSLLLEFGAGRQIATSDYNPIHNWLLIATVYFARPVVDEFLFRGVIYGTCAGRFGIRVAAFTSVVLFVAVSLPQGIDAISLARLTILGIACTGLRVRFDSIVPAIVCHIAITLLAPMMVPLGF